MPTVLRVVLLVVCVIVAFAAVVSGALAFFDYRSNEAMCSGPGAYPGFSACIDLPGQYREMLKIEVACALCVIASGAALIAVLRKR